MTDTSLVSLLQMVVARSLGGPNVAGSLLNFQNIARSLGERHKPGGGVLVVYGSNFDRSALLYLAIRLGGSIHKKTDQEALLCAQEAAVRLHGKPINQHLTSWQSRDETLGHRGGAVRWNGLIFSFCGDASEAADEAFVLKLLRSFEGDPGLGELPPFSPYFLKEAVTASGNPFFAG